MNWKLIVKLSTFGLLLELASVYFGSSWVEPLLWLALYIYNAYAIAAGCRTRRFTNGLVLGLLNSVWITGAHELFLDRFLAHHPREAALVERFQVMIHGASPRHIVAMTGPASGLFWGIVVGVFAVIGGMMMKPKPSPLAID